ncbi:MAG TPA: hypothetical protein VH593_04555 [Ktedonobacteraceae bacterium]|jgi:hypothetical protein
MSKRNNRQAKDGRPEMVTHQGIKEKPEHHADAWMTNPDYDECIALRVKKSTHYMHVVTAVHLYNKLHTALMRWDEQAKGLGHPGLLRVGQDYEAYFARMSAHASEIGFDYSQIDPREPPETYRMPEV